MTDLTITPLTSVLGARVTGLDLRDDVPDSVEERIRDAFWEHLVLVFPHDREVSAAEQNRLAAMFGEPQPLAMFQFLGAPNPELSLNPGTNGRTRIAQSAHVDGAKASPALQRDIMKDELVKLGVGGEFYGWHTDSSYTPWLPRAAVLRAEVIPPAGGDTSFANTCAAYEALSPRMQELLADATAVHIVPPHIKEGLNVWQYGPDAEARFDAEFQPREWPIVIAQPETGKKGLFVNSSYTAHIMGMKRAESNAILRFLFAHITSGSFVYNHRWSPGDLVVWDELMTQHRPPPGELISADLSQRKVTRITTGRVVPTAAFGARTGSHAEMALS